MKLPLLRSLIRRRLLVAYSPGGQVLSTYELAATGAPLPNQVYPEFGLPGMSQTMA